ncbi:MAG TPA: glycosyltransferase family 1 protein [Candidatus Angelobacter sp.]|nr:glycosyltransferase family 1 protein [Candidatus Angelobacter sp.]
MRILHVVGKLDRGGAETWLVQTLRHIDRSKYQFDFLVHTEKPGAYDEEVKSLGARVIPCLAPSNPVRYARNFLRVLREYGPYDCVHSHVYHFNGFVTLLAAIAGIRVRVAHSHSARVHTDAFPRRVYMRAMRYCIARFSTAGIAVSAAAADSLFPQNWVSDKKWSLQPLGIDVERFRGGSNRPEVRNSLNLNTNAFVVGHVGRFVQSKNHQFLVDIAAELAVINKDAHFLLIGDGTLQDSIKKLVEARGLADAFIFTGVRSDIPDLLQAMDVFVFPSLYEGLGLAVIEAQAAGLHCFVSTRIPPEADARANLLTRLSLDEPAKVWADRINSGRRTTALQPLKILSTQDSSELLARFYSDEMSSQTAKGFRRALLTGGRNGGGIA